MRSIFTLGLTAITLAFSIAGSSAATIDLSLLAKGTTEPSGVLPPEGNFSSGFAAMKPQEGNGLRENSFIEPFVSGHKVSSGYVRPDALIAEFPGQALMFKSGQGLMPAQGFQSSPNGFAAMSAAAAQGGRSNRAFDSLLSTSAAVPANIHSPPSK